MTFSPTADNRQSSLVSLPSVVSPSPQSPGFRVNQLIRLPQDRSNRRQRPISCVIPHNQIPVLTTAGDRMATPKHRSNGVVVVSDGRGGNGSLYRSSSTPKVFSVGGGGVHGGAFRGEVAHLQQRVPRFEPLAKWSELEGSDASPLIEMMAIYERHYEAVAALVTRRQDEILRLQRKIEYNSKLAVDSMQLRQRGGGFQGNGDAPMAAGTFQVNAILQGVQELHSRFKTCAKLLGDLKAQAQQLELTMTSET